MTTGVPGEGRSLAEVAQRRLRRWLDMEQIRKRAERGQTVEHVSDRLGPYVTVSREEGAGGSEIARIVAETLEWDLLDRELLNFMAEHHHLPRSILEFVDETTANWLHEAFSQLIDRRVISQQAYVKRLGSIVLLAAYRGKVVIVGRGAQFLLPPENGFAVRVLAPEAYRIQRVMQREGIDHEPAKKLIEETERGRRDFARRYFRQDLTDPHLHDLVVNVAKYGLDLAADLIVRAVRSWLDGTQRQR